MPALAATDAQSMNRKPNHKETQIILDEMLGPKGTGCCNWGPGVSSMVYGNGNLPLYFYQSFILTNLVLLPTPIL